MCGADLLVFPIQVYEHKQPGDLLHMEPRSSVASSGPATERRAIAEFRSMGLAGSSCSCRSRPRSGGSRQCTPGERGENAVQFLRDAVAYYNRLGMTIKRLLPAFRYKPFRGVCEQPGIQ